jgi:hypothetical protein
MMQVMKACAALGVMTAVAGSAHSAIDGLLLGTDAPPPALLGVPMTPFPPDPTPIFTDVSSVASPLGGALLFSFPLSHRMIEQGWATWSHGYMGDVYYAQGASSVSMTLPAQTGAFYLYVETGAFQLAEFTVTATTTGGSVLSLVDDIHGFHGASGFGFVATGGDSLATISVSTPFQSFAIGEFGIAAVPGAGGALLLPLMLLHGRRRSICP